MSASIWSVLVYNQVIKLNEQETLDAYKKKMNHNALLFDQIAAQFDSYFIVIADS